MANEDLSPVRFGSAFKEFMEAVVAAATRPANPLQERIRSHLGAEPSKLTVIAEEFDSYEHPNLQVALDAYLSGPTRQAELVGIAAENKHFMQQGLSDLMSPGFGAYGRVGLAEGPVDYVNFH